jgi:hypothetical protein
MLILGYYFPKIVPTLSIDEVNLSMGELYSIVTNKEKSYKGTILAIVTRTKS